MSISIMGVITALLGIWGQLAGVPGKNPDEEARVVVVAFFIKQHKS